MRTLGGSSRQPALGEFGCGEFHDRLNNLSDEEPKAALAYLHELDDIVNGNFIFIHSETREALCNLFEELQMLPSMELACFDGANIDLKDPSLYEKTIMIRLPYSCTFLSRFLFNFLVYPRNKTRILKELGYKSLTYA
jgi:hypothetical protein